MNHFRLFSLCLCLSLAACGGSDSGSSPTASAPETDSSPAPEAPSTSQPISDSSEPPVPEETLASDAEPPIPSADAPEVLDRPPQSETPVTDESLPEPVTELVSGLRAPRDLIFGPASSELDDELFVVNFFGVEATWVRDFGDAGQSLARIQNSLVGAIAVDLDQEGNFFFACLIPAMDGNFGVITVRRFDSAVTDFQYAGVSGPIGVALDSQGGLFVANRDSRSVTRIDFADGASPDQHGVNVVAQGLQFVDSNMPAHLLVDPEDRLFICETGGNRIQTWSAETGQTVFASADQGLNQPVGIAQRANGNLLVSNHGDGTIVELDPKGVPVRLLDTGLGADVLYGIGVRGDDQVYVVTDRDNRGNVYRVNL